MRLLILALGAGLVLAGCQTTGQNAGAQSASLAADSSAAAESADPGDKVRCKYMPVTGSRMGRKVCHTEREWKAMEDSARETMRDIQSNPNAFDFDGG